MIKVIGVKSTRYNIVSGHPHARKNACSKNIKYYYTHTLPILYFNLTNNRCHDQIKKKLALFEFGYPL